MDKWTYGLHSDLSWLLFVALGMCFFSWINFLTRWCIPNAVMHQTRRNAFEAQWKWKNVLTSFIHSSITGIWAPAAFMMHPALGADMMRGYSVCAHSLVAFSIGYFIYDFFDMFLYHRKGSTYELLLHHVTVISCFSIATASKTYVAYAALSLVVEINSIFLHARQLLIFGGVSKSSKVYRANALMNVATFVLFRILLLGWMTRWITLHRDDVPILFFTVGSLGLATIVTMNIILFYRILVGDYLSKTSTDKENHHHHADHHHHHELLLLHPDSRRQHPITDDVNRIVRSLFDEQELIDVKKFD